MLVLSIICHLNMKKHMPKKKNTFFNINIFSFDTKACFFKTQVLTQSAITCSKLTTETLEQGVKYVQS